jgi:hypothetical protein
MGRAKQQRLRALSRGYEVFHERLQALGCSSYQAYLATPHWQGLRKKYRVIGRRCKGCGNTATCIHHLTYATLGEEDPRLDLLPLCHDCHEKVHTLLSDSGRGVEWSIWALRRIFGWTPHYTRIAFHYLTTHRFKGRVSLSKL